MVLTGIIDHNKYAFRQNERTWTAWSAAMGMAPPSRRVSRPEPIVHTTTPSTPPNGSNPNHVWWQCSKQCFFCWQMVLFFYAQYYVQLFIIENYFISHFYLWLKPFWCTVHMTWKTTIRHWQRNPKLSWEDCGKRRRYNVPWMGSSTRGRHAGVKTLPLHTPAW